MAANPEKDRSIVEQAVKSDRQRLNQAKTLIENQTNKQFSKKTLQRFLKKLSADTAESDESLIQRFMRFVNSLP